MLILLSICGLRQRIDFFKSFSHAKSCNQDFQKKLLNYKYQIYSFVVESLRQKLVVLLVTKCSSTLQQSSTYLFTKEHWQFSRELYNIKFQCYFRMLVGKSLWLIFKKEKFAALEILKKMNCSHCLKFVSRW